MSQLADVKTRLAADTVPSAVFVELIGMITSAVGAVWSTTRERRLRVHPRRWSSCREAGVTVMPAGGVSMLTVYWPIQP